LNVWMIVVGKKRRCRPLFIEGSQTKWIWTMVTCVHNEIGEL